MAIVGKIKNNILNNDQKNKVCLKYINHINNINEEEKLEVKENENCKTITGVKKVVFSPEEDDRKKQLIATASDNGDIYIWNYKKGKDLIKEALSNETYIKAHYKNKSGQEVLSIQFSQDTDIEQK